jgi:hypothetical protein
MAEGEKDNWWGVFGGGRAAWDFVEVIGWRWETVMTDTARMIMRVGRINREGGSLDLDTLISI